MRPLSLTFGLAGMLLAQQGSIDGPVPGLVYDRAARTVRPMLGVPGAAYLGSVLESDVDAASIAPNGSLALLTRGGATILRQGAALLPLDNTLGNADGFAWSSDSNRAVVYSSAAGQAQLLEDLSGSPAAGSALDLSGIDGALTALAVDGSRVVAGARGGVYLLAAGNAPRQIAAANFPVALIVSGGVLYVADRGGDAILEIRNYAEGPESLVFASAASPAGLGMAGGRLVVATQSGVDVYDLASRTVLQHLDLDFTATRFERLGQTPFALLNSASEAEPLYVLNAQDNLAVYFVPGGRSE